MLWHNSEICLQKDMEIDFGGIGKEYAADCAVKRVHQLIAELSAELIAKQSNTHKNNVSMLINLGGNLAITGPRKNGDGWQISVNLGKSVTSSQPSDFSLKQGGVATSGNANRYLLKDGVRYSHVLDPRSGWPINGAPAAVTVVAPSCTDAGMLSTMALLQGPAAENFLREQDVPYWCQW